MLRILVIEDNDGVRKFIRKTLELEGYDVYEAPDGVAAIDELRQQPADDLALDFGSASANRTDACIAPQALHLIFRHVAIAPENLNRLIGNKSLGFGTVYFHD